jgi:hypothetical protein
MNFSLCHHTRAGSRLYPLPLTINRLAVSVASVVELILSNSRSPDRYSNPEPNEYESGMLTKTDTLAPTNTEL